ncbi:hypothetical protein Pelo_17107 [Pelomyxa schiedti]|nr:hypothetical protein Pelo_17107 [Pelomyxa schiedti]
MWQHFEVQKQNASNDLHVVFQHRGVVPSGIAPEVVKLNLKLLYAAVIRVQVEQIELSGCVGRQDLKSLFNRNWNFFLPSSVNALAENTHTEVNRLCKETEGGDIPIAECLIRRNALLEALKCEPKFSNIHPTCVRLFCLVVESCLSILVQPAAVPCN